jgi:hypothetical protein
MSANIKNENTEHVDLTSILKDVENCIRSGLSNKLDTFFYEYDRYKKTHEEVLNLSIVRELLKRGSSVSEGTKPKLDPELEMIVLRNQVIFLRGEVNKYKNQAEALVLAQAQAPELESEPESSQLNLEIKEKEPELLDIKSEEQDNGHDDEDVDDGDVLDNDDDDEDEDGDGDVSETSSEGDGSDDDTEITNTNTNTNYLSHIVEDSIQNIVLNVTEKEEAEEEVMAEEEAEEEVVTEEEEEEVVADEEEEEDLPIKMPTFPTKTKPEPAVEVKPVIVEEEEEEEEDEVETETEEDSDEEEEAEPAHSPELKVSTPEENAEEEEEEEELYEVEINGIMYVTNDDEDGTIYSYDNEEVGDKVGEFKGLVAHIYNGKNKGIYDRTMCKMNF